MRHGRSLAFIAFLSSAAMVNADTYGIAQMSAQVVRALQDAKLLPIATKEPVTNIGGGQSRKPSDVGQLPGPRPTPSKNDRILRVIRAGTYENKGGHVRMTGGTEIEYRGYRCFADTTEGDTDTQIFTFSGNVTVVGADAIVRGQQLTVDFIRKTFIGKDIRSEIRPNLAKNYLKDRIFVTGREEAGDEHYITAKETIFTSCDYAQPHYEFDSENAVIIPGKRAILRDSILRIKGKRILRIPYLVIPLDDPGRHPLPVVGQSPQEGYYIKERFTLNIPGENQLQARTDYFSKLGTGLGAEYKYGLQQRNTFRLYTIPTGPHEVQLESHHRQDIARGTTLQLDNSIDRNNYLSAPGSENVYNRGQLELQSKSAQTRIAFDRYASNSSGFGTENQTMSFADTRTIGAALKTDLNLNLANNRTTITGQPDIRSEILDVHLKATEDSKKASTELLYQRSIPVGTVDNFFSTTDQTPLLTIRSDSRRLMGPKVWLPFNLSYSVGNLIDPVQKDSITRNSLNVDWRRSDDANKRFRLDTSGRFEQNVYSDSTAQFQLALNEGLAYRLGKDSVWNLRYNYLRPQGFSPLAIDSSGSSNVATTDITYHLSSRMLVGGQTGYDFLKNNFSVTPWQQVGIRAEYTPRRDSIIRTLTTYDPSSHAFSNIRLDYSAKSGGLFFALGARYDGIQKKLGDLNVYLSGLRYGRTTLEARIAYNGYLKQFQDQQLAFVYDLHDAELVFTYSDSTTGVTPGKQFGLFLRLKFLPFNNTFGVGRQGQPIGTSTGRDF